MSVKSLATAAAAVAAIGAAATGVTSLASVSPAPAHVQPVVFGAPLPLDPAAQGLPSPDQLVSVLNGLQNPNVPFASKGYLVEGGIGGAEGSIADHELKKAAQHGALPLSFNVANIAPAGPGSASADVTASGPTLAPTTQNITVINQGSWKLSRA
ncbi:MAG: hypothetical protein ACRDTV_23195, partial [Mycobacterium sp.]